MKKIISFFILCLYVLGAIGGFGYSLYYGNYLIASAIVLLTAMAFPMAYKFWDILNK